jgi:hypothetical protein
MKWCTWLLGIVCFTQIWGQAFPYRVTLGNMQIPEVGGMQSYAFATHDGKWLIIGGRLDGLHKRQPWASFDSLGHNRTIWVIDPEEKKTWRSDLTKLHPDVQDQLSSTNMAFCQRDNTLYLVGGYGQRSVDGQHVTHPFLCSIDVPGLITSISEGSDITPFFYQIKDERFAVCGGKLVEMDSIYYVVGGHRFDGRYNPMNGPSFTQTYTDAVRRFQLKGDGKRKEVEFLAEWKKEELFHRRDLNLLPQLMSDGQLGYVLFSGVFQPDTDQPYLTSVIIRPDTCYLQPDFAQYFNHYHCASISLFDAENGNMHNLFFGGIAQYTDSAGFLVQDNDIPFVRTISRVTRTPEGWSREYRLPTEMPDWLGAASEFILHPDVPSIKNHIIDLQRIKGDSILLGYIFGGIRSTAPNIFWINDNNESSASSSIFPVYLIRDAGAESLMNDQSINRIQLQVFPNPVDNEFNLGFTLHKPSDVQVTVKNLMGEIAFSKSWKRLPSGRYERLITYRKLNRGDVYYLHLFINGELFTQKILVN